MYRIVPVHEKLEAAAGVAAASPKAGELCV